MRPIQLDLSRTKPNDLQQPSLADLSAGQIDTIRTILRRALDRHLNVHQSFRIDARETILLDERLPPTELLNRTLRLANNSIVHFHSITTGASNVRETVHVELQLDPLAPYGDGQASTNYSRALSLSIFRQDGTELPLAAISQETELIIPRDPQLRVPPLLYENVANGTTKSFHWKSIDLDELRTDTYLSFSLHFQFIPLSNLSTSVGYAFAYQFNQSSQLDRLDGWRLLCPSTATNGLLSTYIDNQQIADGDHRLLIFGVRELTGEELREWCSQPSLSAKGFSVKNERARFSVDYRWRMFSSGCYYLDDQRRWQSDGLLVRLPSSPPLIHHLVCFRLDRKLIFIRRNASSVEMKLRKMLLLKTERKNQAESHGFSTHHNS